MVDIQGDNAYPVLNIVDYSNINLPKDGYFFFPKPEEELKGKEKKMMRWYFEGQVKFTDYE